MPSNCDEVFGESESRTLLSIYTCFERHWEYTVSGSNIRQDRDWDGRKFSEWEDKISKYENEIEQKTLKKGKGRDISD